MQVLHHGAYAPGLATPDLAHHVDLAPLVATSAPPAGLSPPTKENAAELGSEGGAEVQTKEGSPDCADHHRPQQPDEAAPDTKRLATLRARLALAGWELHTSHDGAHVITRWGMVRHCTSVDAVEAFVKQVGVRA